MFENQQLNKS